MLNDIHIQSILQATKKFLKTKEFNLSPTLIFAYCQGDGFVEQEVSNPAQDINLEVVSALSTPQTGKVKRVKS